MAIQPVSAHVKEYCSSLGSAHGLRNEFYLISYVAFRPTDVRKENRASSHSEELLLNKTLSDLIQFRPRWGCAIIFPHAPTLLRVRE